MTQENENEAPVPSRGTKYFQVCEPDLAEMEKIMPAIYDVAMMQIANSPRLRVQCRRMKEILSNIRWNYGPHSECIELPADDGGPTP